MPRDIPIGNGNLLITFDARFQIRDFYFPHPGRENQSSGKPFRFGVWAGGQFSWVSSDDWTREMRYQEETLVTNVILRSTRLGLELIVNDAVDFHENVFLRRVDIFNTTDRQNEVRLFFHHDFHISESAIGDTAYYDPMTSGLVHYKRNRYFLAGCHTDGKGSFDQWATGAKEFHEAEGTWRDAEDGSLGGNPIAQGSVDSTIGIGVEVSPGSRKTVTYWIAAGKSHQEVKTINDTVRAKSVEAMLDRTAEYWRAWVNKEGMNFADLQPKVIASYKRSLLTIRTNVDNNGAILAANDSDVETYNGDTYSYVWPRDGALTAYSLDISGFSELTRRFYFFMKELMDPGGYFLHKYTPDGTLGSTWLPWVSDGTVQLPIQEDETALILVGLWKHYNEHRDVEYIADFYRRVIKSGADFLVTYRNPETGLPLPSWDLWEERRGIHTFTVATVWAGLQAAARFADLFGEREMADKYSTAAEEIKRAMVRHLYLPNLGRYVRTAYIKGGPNRAPGSPLELEYDTKIDASLVGIWYFGVFDPNDERVQSTMKAVRDRLWVKTDVGGLARYENDTYHQVSQDVDTVPGNPWFVCTLWLAQYEILLAKSREELKPALELVHWVVDHALPSGVLAEQVNPFKDDPLSVSPLTWSHSELLSTIMAYLQRVRELNLCPECGSYVFDFMRRDTGVIPARLDEFKR